MDGDTIMDVPNDHPETYCRLCFSGFYVEPLFPPAGEPKQAVIDLIGRLVDIHLAIESDYSSAVCRMCQMTLEGFHKYREKCRQLDMVLNRKRLEQMNLLQVKVEQQEEMATGAAAQNAVGFEEDMVYCLSDSEEEGDRREDDGMLGDEEHEEIDEEVEEELIKGDLLIKPEPYGEAEEEEEDEDEEGEGHNNPEQNRNQQHQHQVASVDGSDVVVLDSDEEQEHEQEGEEEQQSTVAPSTRASSEARGEDQQGREEPTKALPFEVTDDGGYRCTICQETFRLMKEIKIHIRKEHPEHSQVYSCTFCGKKFSDTNSLRVHTRWHTNDFPFKCNDCGAQFSKKNRYEAHVSKYHDKNSPLYTEERFNCSLCPRVFLSVQALNIHVVHFHEGKSIKKVKKSPGAARLDRDMTPLPVFMVYFCEACDEPFESVEAGNAHFAEKHPDNGEEGQPKLTKRYKCLDCQKTYRNRPAYRAHTLTNHGTMPQKCDICGSGFLTRKRLAQHKEKWHGANAKNKDLERYKCDHCDRFFMRNQDRFRHEQIIHNIGSPEKLPSVWEGRKSNFPCSKCDRKFATMKQMRIHFAHKHPEVPVRFKCTICSKLFRHQTSMRDHMKNHTGEQPFACTQCNERFVRKKDMDHHMEIDHGSDGEINEERVRLPCPHCPRKFLTKNARRIHIKHHHADKDPIEEKDLPVGRMRRSRVSSDPLTREILSSIHKTLTCSHCKKTFTNRNTLKLHILNHLGKLPHQCDQCESGFYKPADLERHKQRYHVGGSALSLASRFKCAYCPRVFTRKSARHHHHSVFHGIKRAAKVPSGPSKAGRRRGIKSEPGESGIEFPCALCSIAFVTSHMLQTHHQQQHPDQQFFFKCPHCPKRTAYRSSFVIHIKSHIGGYRFPCDQCSNKFDQKILLVKHKMRYHSDSTKDVPLFRCTVCSREFLRNQDRVRHQKDMHNYVVQGTKAASGTSPGPSSASSSLKTRKKKGALLKIKQERQTEVDPVDSTQDSADTKPELPLPRSRKKGFAISSDVEEIQDDDDDEDEEEQGGDGGAEQQQPEQHEEEVGETSVPTISNVVSIKQEAMAGRRGFSEYQSEF